MILCIFYQSARQNRPANVSGTEASAIVEPHSRLITDWLLWPEVDLTTILACCKCPLGLNYHTAMLQVSHGPTLVRLTYCTTCIFYGNIVMGLWCVFYNAMGLGCVFYNLMGLQDVFSSLMGLRCVFYTVMGLGGAFYNLVGLGCVFYNLMGLQDVFYSLMGLRCVFYTVMGLGGAFYNLVGLGCVFYNLMGLGCVFYNLMDLTGGVYCSGCCSDGLGVCIIVLFWV